MISVSWQWEKTERCATCAAQSPERRSDETVSLHGHLHVPPRSPTGSPASHTNELSEENSAVALSLTSGCTYAHTVCIKS